MASMMNPAVARRLSKWALSLTNGDEEHSIIHVVAQVGRPARSSGSSLRRTSMNSSKIRPAAP
eukprot:3811210-Heterocapsa_arctica.AAC.1